MSKTHKTHSLSADNALAAYFGLLAEEPVLAERFLNDLILCLPSPMAERLQQCQQVIEAPHLYPFPYEPFSLLAFILYLHSLKNPAVKKFGFYNASQPYLAGYLQVLLKKHCKFDTISWQETIHPHQEKIGLQPSLLSASDREVLQSTVVTLTQHGPLVRFSDDAAQLAIDPVAEHVHTSKNTNKTTVSLSLWSYDNQAQRLTERKLGQITPELHWENQNTAVTIPLPANLRLDLFAANFNQCYLSVQIQLFEEYWIPMRGMLDDCSQRAAWFRRPVKRFGSFSQVTVELPSEWYQLCLQRFWWFDSTTPEARLCIAKGNLLLPTTASLQS